jgi:preprotein translocase subunit Sec63
MDIRKCYEILELRPGYSAAELKQAYKDLVQVWHPDRFAHNPRLKEKAEEKLKQINQAYAVLDQAQRDRAKFQAAKSTTPSVVDPESVVKTATWTTAKSSSDLVRLRLGMLAWMLGVSCLPIVLILLAYLLVQYLLVIVAAGLVITGYFAVRWWIEQS